MVINHVYRIPLDAIRMAFKRTKEGLSTDPKTDIHYAEEELIKHRQYCFRALDTLYPTKRRTTVPAEDGTVVYGTGAMHIHKSEAAKPFWWKTELSCVDNQGMLIELRSCKVPKVEWLEGDESQPKVSWLGTAWGSYVLVYYVTRHGVVASWYTDDPAEARCMYMRAILGECA